MKEIIAAAIGALVSMALSALMTMKESSRFFSSTVSSERMNWIKDVRQLATELFTVCEQYSSLDSALHNLLSEPDFDSVKEHLPQIRLMLGTILKNEWDKVKVEAGNSRGKVRKIEKIQAKIEMDKYEN